MQSEPGSKSEYDSRLFAQQRRMASPAPNHKGNAFNAQRSLNASTGTAKCRPDARRCL